MPENMASADDPDPLGKNLEDSLQSVFTGNIESFSRLTKEEIEQKIQKLRSGEFAAMPTEAFIKKIQSIVTSGSHFLNREEWLFGIQEYEQKESSLHSAQVNKRVEKTLEIAA